MDCETCKRIRSGMTAYEEHSPEWSVSAELIKTNRRWKAFAITALVLWAMTVLAFAYVVVSTDNGIRYKELPQNEYEVYFSEQKSDKAVSVPGVQTLKRKKRHAAARCAV